MRYSIRSLLLLTLVVALLLTGFLFVRQRFEDLLEGEPPSLVANSEAWPRALHDLLSEAEVSSGESQSIRVYRNMDWAFDSEYLWSCDLLPSLVETLVEDRGLVPIETNGKVARAFVQKIPDNWRVPDLSQNCKVYSTPNFMIEYLEGEMYVLIIDHQQNEMFIWYTFRF